MLIKNVFHPLSDNKTPKLEFYYEDNQHKNRNEIAPKRQVLFKLSPGLKTKFTELAVDPDKQGFDPTAALYTVSIPILLSVPYWMTPLVDRIMLPQG